VSAAAQADDAEKRLLPWVVAAMFIPDRFHSDASRVIYGIRLAFIVLGVRGDRVAARLLAQHGAPVQLHNSGPTAEAI